MNIKLQFSLLLAPILAVAQIHTSPGISSSLGGGIRYTMPDYDADAVAYFTRAGVTDPTAKQQLSDFVKGLKSQGLWSSVVCWPMRSLHNAGNDTTVYSLGGLTTANGTLANAPTWTPEGIEFVGASSTRMTAMGVPGNGGTGVSMFAVAAGNASQGGFAQLVTWQGADYLTVGSLLLTRGSSNTIRGQTCVSSATVAFIDNANFDVTSTAFRAVAAKTKSSDIVGAVVPNTTATTAATGSYSLTLDRVVIGTRNATLTTSICWTGKIALVIACNSEAAYTGNAALYSLVKATIGQGLSLP